MPSLPALTIKEACEATGLSRNTIRRRIASGDLPAYKYGERSYRIKAEDLEALKQPANAAAVTERSAKTIYARLQQDARKLALLGGVTPQQRDHIIDILGGDVA